MNLCSWKPLLLAFLSIYIWSCSSDKGNEQFTGDGIYFEEVSMMKISSGCSEQKQECAKVSVDYPLAKTGDAYIKDKINKVTKQKVLESLAVFSEHDNKLVEDLDVAMAEFIKLYESYVRESNFFSIPWELKIDGEVLYQSEKMVCLKLENSSYTGGAHPNEYTTLLNFNTETGDLLELNDIVSDVAKLRVLAEESILGKRKKEVDESDVPVIELASDSYFTLPENFAIQKNGILLFYNPYEASDYASGTLSFLLSYDDLNSILANGFKSLNL